MFVSSFFLVFWGEETGLVYIHIHQLGEWPWVPPTLHFGEGMDGGQHRAAGGTDTDKTKSIGHIACLNSILTFCSLDFLKKKTHVLEATQLEWRILAFEERCSLSEGGPL